MSCNCIPVRYTVLAVLCHAMRLLHVELREWWQLDFNGSSTLKTVACLRKLGDNWHAYKNGDRCYRLNGRREPFFFFNGTVNSLNGNGSEMFTPFFNPTVRKRERFSDAYCMQYSSSETYT